MDGFTLAVNSLFFDVRGANTIIETFFFSISFFILSQIDFSPSLLSLSFSSSIDVKGLLKKLPGGNVAACTRVGFS